MRLVYLTIGFMSLGLGIIGIPLPILPTTPFLLLSMACFAKSSKRFETWLYQTKLYQTYVSDYRETKSIAKERKKWILLQIYILMENSGPRTRKRSAFVLLFFCIKIKTLVYQELSFNEYVFDYASGNFNKRSNLGFLVFYKRINS